MRKDLSVLRIHSQLQLFPEIDLRPSNLVLVRLHVRITLLAIHVNCCDNDMKLLQKKAQFLAGCVCVGGGGGKAPPLCETCCVTVRNGTMPQHASNISLKHAPRKQKQVSLPPAVSTVEISKFLN